MACVPGPLNSCTVRWTDPESTEPQGRLQAHARTHPTGGLQEQCDTAGNGLAVCLFGSPDLQDPPSGTDSGLRVTSTGKLWRTFQARKKRTVSAGFAAGLTIDRLIVDETLTIDNTLADVDTCWQICVDVCGALIDCPAGGPATVAVPPADVTLPSGGGTTSHSHGTINVAPAPKSGASLELTIGDRACDYLSADKFYATYSGRICHEVTAAAGQQVDIPVQVNVRVRDQVSSGFTASSGQLVVYLEQVGCAEDC